MTDPSLSSKPVPAKQKGPRLLLAGSGGGHVRQLLNLEDFWKDRQPLFLTEDTALGRSIAENHDVAFVPHFAFGQAKLGAPIKMLWAGIRNAVDSFSVIRRFRPQVVISTGAGSMFFATLWARMFGARIVLIDSFARFEKPSLFARLVAPFAQEKIVQSPRMADSWKGVSVFDPFVIDEPEAVEKEDLLFATVGATLPFDRLVESIETLAKVGKIPERIVIQTGEGGYAPDGMEVHEMLRFEEIKDLLARARIVICHGGTGSIITALERGCRVVTMPRLFEKKEHYDNHQEEIAEAFSIRGVVGMAKDVEELEAALIAAREREPVRARTDYSALMKHLEARWRAWFPSQDG